MSPASPTVTAVILAAGQARRMAGRDKGLLPYAGRSLIEHVIEALKPQVASLALNCRPQSDGEYRAFGLRLLHDQTPELGPLGGIASALAHSESEWLLIVPCDTPFLPPDLLERLWQAAEGQHALAVSVDDGQRRHYTILLLHRSLEKALHDYLAAGERRVQAWLEQVGTVYADFSDSPEAFTNINRPEDLGEAP